MASKRLFSNAVLPPTLQINTNNYEVGCSFSLSPGTWYLVGMGWYNPDPAGVSPVLLRTWRASDQVVLDTINPAPDNNTVGKQEALASGSVVLSGGTTYVTTAQLPNAARWATLPDSQKGEAEYPLLWVDPEFRRTNAGSYGYPTVTDSTIAPFIYPIVSDGPVTDESPLIDSDIENALVRWFDSGGDNTRTAEIPWQTKLVVDGIQATQGVHTNTLATVLGSISAGGADTVLARAATILALLQGAGGIVEVLQNVYNNLTQGVTLDSLAVDIANVRSDQLLTVGRQLLPVGGAGWTLDFTQSLSASAAWSHQADAYVIEWTDPNAPADKELVDGIQLVWARDHWASVLRGSAVGRHFPLNARVNEIHGHGVRMPSLLINDPKGFPYTISAWRYTG